MYKEADKLTEANGGRCWNWKQMELEANGIGSKWNWKQLETNGIGSKWRQMLEN